MSKASSLLLFLSPVMALLLSVAHQRPEWLVRAGIDFGDLGVYERQLVEEEKKGHDLEQRLRQSESRLTAKTAIVAEVQAGRLTLFAAAARFRDLDRRSPIGSDCYIEMLPGASLGEKYCHSIIVWIDPYDHPGTETAASRLAQRLEEELQEHLRRHGTVQLPQ
jgi:hypothetical protein